MQLSLPPIKDPALQKFCEEHELYDILVAAYHYAQKLACFKFPKKCVDTLHGREGRKGRRGSSFPSSLSSLLPITKSVKRFVKHARNLIITYEGVLTNSEKCTCSFALVGVEEK
jgi:hypothetical protein